MSINEVYRRSERVNIKKHAREQLISQFNKVKINDKIPVLQIIISVPNNFLHLKQNFINIFRTDNMKRKIKCNIFEDDVIWRK